MVRLEFWFFWLLIIGLNKQKENSRIALYLSLQKLFEYFKEKKKGKLDKRKIKLREKKKEKKNYRKERGWWLGGQLREQPKERRKNNWEQLNRPIGK